MISPPVDPPPIDRDAVLPSVDEVAMLERTRTIGPGGHDIPTFTDVTRPTADEAQALIERQLGAATATPTATHPVSTAM